jgi:hypothetical protein
MICRSLPFPIILRTTIEKVCVPFFEISFSFILRFFPDIFNKNEKENYSKDEKANVLMVLSRKK